MEGTNSPQWEWGYTGTSTHHTVGSGPTGTGCSIPHREATYPSPRQRDSTASHSHPMPQHTSEPEGHGDPKPNPKPTLRSTRCPPRSNTESPQKVRRPAHSRAEDGGKVTTHPKGLCLPRGTTQPLCSSAHLTLLALRAKRTKNPTAARKGSAPLRCGRERGKKGSPRPRDGSARTGLALQLAVVGLLAGREVLLHQERPRHRAGPAPPPAAEPPPLSVS